MAKADKILARMRGNPRDWRIEDVITVCRNAGVDCTPPSNGSHYKIKHRGIERILTIPAHRPIKPIYIRELVKFVDDVVDAAE